MVYGAAREGPRSSAPYVAVASAVGGLAPVAGVIALVIGSAAMLAASVAGLWMITTTRHVLVFGGGSHSRRPAKTA